MPDDTNTEARGWVYLIVNDLIEDRLKIGYTKQDPVDRAYELLTTGTTGTFVVIYQAYVLNPYIVEQEVHRRLAEFNRGREWFEVCPNRAKEEIIAVAGGVLYEDVTPRWHRSQPEPREWTKERLSEAKQAAEELRRQKQQAEEQSRLEEEQRRLRQEQEAEAERQRQEQEQYQRLAEEKARALRETEQHAREEEERARQRVEDRLRRNSQLAQLGIGTTIAASLIFLIYAAFGPHSETHIDGLRKHATDLKAQEAALLSDRNKALVSLQRARNLIESLAEKETRLRTDLEALKKTRATAAVDVRIKSHLLDEVIETFSPEGVPRARDGLSVQAIRAEIDLRRRALEKAKARYSQVSADYEKTEMNVRAIPNEQHDAKEQEVRYSHAVESTTSTLEQLGREVISADLLLDSAIKHNARFFMQSGPQK